MATHLPKAVTISGTPVEKKLKNISTGMLGAGALGLIAALAVGLTDHSADHAEMARFYSSYLLGLVIFLGIGVTGMFFSALQFLANVGWSALVRRIAEALASAVPFVLVASLPIIVNVFTDHSSIYHWAHSDVYQPNSPTYDQILVEKQAYLNPGFFAIRMVLYCLVWLGMYGFIVRNSYKQDEMPGDYTPTKKNWKRAAPFILGYALTMTFAAFDLIMSLDPHWFSTIFGIYFFAGSWVSTIALVTLIALALKNAGIIPINNAHLHDLGKFMFAFNVFWAYIAFSQYFLIWYANLPEETLYFIHRKEHGWEFVFYALIFLHFVVPFALLLPQDNKKNPKILAFSAVLIIVMHAVDMAYNIVPNVAKDGLRLGWQELSGDRKSVV